jgi:hypothetical protein
MSVPVPDAFSLLSSTHRYISLGLLKPLHHPHQLPARHWRLGLLELWRVHQTVWVKRFPLGRSSLD